MRGDFNSLIETRISDLIDSEIKTAPTKEAKQLLDSIRNSILSGGKRFRPKLLNITYAAYGGKNSKHLIDLAVALELHHQFLLIHDDIIDQDTTRYGPNVIGHYLKMHQSGRHIAESMGLLAGDLLFTLTHLVIIKNQYYDSKQKIELLRLINEASQVTVYGEQLDILGIDVEDSLTTERMELISSLKTAAYSTCLPMHCAAALINLPKNERNNIDKFALAFGILFQLVDDYSDYFENNSAFNNRPKYRDARQAKITYPLYLALKKASPRDRVFLKGIPDNTVDSKDIKKVLAIMEVTGTKEECQNLLELYFNSTYKALDKLDINKESKQVFIKLIDSFKV